MLNETFSVIFKHRANTVIFPLYLLKIIVIFQAAMYGMAQKIPDSSLIEEIAENFIDVLYSTKQWKFWCSAMPLLLRNTNFLLPWRKVLIWPLASILFGISQVLKHTHYMAFTFSFEGKIFFQMSKMKYWLLTGIIGWMPWTFEKTSPRLDT